MQRTAAHDVDEHAERLSGWRQRYDQLTAGAFRGDLEELCTERAQVYRERTSQALQQRCEVWPDAVWCGLTVNHDGSRIEGRLVGNDGVMVCGQAAEFELLSPAGHDLLGVVVSRTDLERHAQALGVTLGWQLVDRAPWLEVLPQRRRQAGVMLRSILALAASACETHQQAEAARESMRQAIVEVVVDLLEQPLEPHDAARSNALGRRGVVRQVQAWVDAHPDTVPSVPDLCALLHVCRRTLQYAFEAEVGLSPKAYLRCIRLNGVRRALRQASSPDQTVQGVAAAWGFWSLSQFASDYRRLFGELPSQTLAAARGRGTLASVLTN